MSAKLKVPTNFNKGYLIEGDILLTEQQMKVYNQIISGVKVPFHSFIKKWPNSIIHYELSADVLDADAVRSALKVLNTKSCVKFVEAEKGKNTHNIVVTATKGGCWSNLGYLLNQPQRLNLDEGCYTERNIQHQFLHAAGILHENVRPDRDEFIKINKAENPNEEVLGNLKMPIIPLYYQTPYDYKSIMHSASNIHNGKGPSIQSLEPGMTLDSESASPLDIIDLNLFYGCPSSLCRTNHTQCITGTCCNTKLCTFSVNWQPCRKPRGLCDAEENCTGKSTTCPVDELLPAGTACGASTSKVCTGSSIFCSTKKMVSRAADKGEKGEKGEKGDKGDKGDKGEKGDKGNRGIKGQKGSNGDNGDKGATGDKGEKGSRGDKGILGDAGEKGVAGDKGDKGDRGAKGAKGNTGDQGDKGVKGDRGNKGDKGNKGINGDKGEKGDNGDKGDKGNTGDKGNKGSKGNTGDKGVKGNSGDSGDKGNKGSKGDKGNQGEKGSRGDVGIKGDQGNTGVTGDKGNNGNKGLKGDRGDVGDKGDNGDKGEKGAKGDLGNKGEKGDKAISANSSVRINVRNNLSSLKRSQQTFFIFDSHFSENQMKNFYFEKDGKVTLESQTQVKSSKQRHSFSNGCPPNHSLVNSQCQINSFSFVSKKVECKSKDFNVDQGCDSTKVDCVVSKSDKEVIINGKPEKVVSEISFYDESSNLNKIVEPKCDLLVALPLSDEQLTKCGYFCYLHQLETVYENEDKVSCEFVPPLSEDGITLSDQLSYLFVVSLQSLCEKKIGISAELEKEIVKDTFSQYHQINSLKKELSQEVNMEQQLEQRYTQEEDSLEKEEQKEKLIEREIVEQKESFQRSIEFEQKRNQHLEERLNEQSNQLKLLGKTIAELSSRKN